MAVAKSLSVLVLTLLSVRRYSLSNDFYLEKFGKPKELETLNTNLLVVVIFNSRKMPPSQMPLNNYTVTISFVLKVPAAG
jgi:hypothetical protein